MSAPRMDTELARLGRTSMLSSVVSLLGLAVFVGALLYGRQQIARIDAQRAALRAETDSALGALTLARDSLASARCALSSSRAAIAGFHRHDYRGAIALYDEALRCDPNNAYLLNLKAYAAFKSNDLALAITTQRRSLALDSTYAWGYMDLGRFLCATGDTVEGRKALERSLRLQREMRGIMSGDTELPRVCGTGLMVQVLRSPRER